MQQQGMTNNASSVLGASNNNKSFSLGNISKKHVKNVSPPKHYIHQVVRATHCTHSRAQTCLKVAMITTGFAVSDDERSVVLRAIALVRRSMTTSSAITPSAATTDKVLAPAAGKRVQFSIPVNDTQTTGYNEQMAPKILIVPELTDMGSSKTITFNGGGRARLSELDIAALLEQWQGKLSMTSSSSSSSSQI